MKSKFVNHSVVRMDNFKKRVDEWVRANLSKALQVNKRWIILYPCDRDEITCQLTKKYIEKFHQSASKWNAIPAEERSIIVEEFNAAVIVWFSQNYQSHDRSRFREISTIIYDPAYYPDEMSKAVVQRGGDCDCDDGCGEFCSRREKNLECRDSCNSGGFCTNKESRLPFDWDSLLEVLFISPQMGAGVFAKTDIPRGTFLGVVTGFAITEEELKKRLDYKNGDYDNSNLFGARKRNGDPLWAIDASKAGNHTRFVNSRCKPNVGTFTWVAQNRLLIKMISVENICAVSRRLNF